MASPENGWDEPKDAASPRGWLRKNGHCVGDYLDYGPDHYRSPHGECVPNNPFTDYITYCTPERLCRECQPGNVLAMRFPAGPGTAMESRYVETISEARQFIETGKLERNNKDDA